MIAVDTNILVRLFVKDDEQQRAQAEDLCQSNNIFVSKTVLIECFWVLTKVYGKSEIIALQDVIRICALPNFIIEDYTTVLNAFDLCLSRKIEFADALHYLSAAGAAGFATFDKPFVKAAKDLKPVVASPKSLLKI